MRGGHWLLRQPLLAAGVPSISAFPPRLDDESKIKKKALRRISVRVGSSAVGTKRTNAGADLVSAADPKPT